MAYDVFLSYSHVDSDLCDRLERIIRQLGHVPFRDVADLTGGWPWNEELMRALAQPDIEPHVVVLCTKAAAEKPDRIVAELAEAKKHGLIIVPLECWPGSTAQLLESAGWEDPTSVHHIEGWMGLADSIEDERVEDGLRRVLTRRARESLNGFRVFAKEWADKLNPTPSFWSVTWQEYFPLVEGSRQLSDSIALTARGGSGKTHLIAQLLRFLLEDPTYYPILVDETLLRQDSSELPKLLGARSAQDLPTQLRRLAEQPPGEHRAWKPMHVVFVVDGLDQMVSPGDGQQRLFVDGLNLMAKSGSVVIGCRKEVWDTWYSGRVSADEREVRELDEPQVRRYLQGRAESSGWRFNPLLKIPFFLDLVLQQSLDHIPSKETGFLQLVWSDAVRDSNPLQGDIGRQWLVENLAQCQLAQLTYAVSLRKLKARPGFIPAYQEGLRALKQDGFLVEQPSMDSVVGSTIRWRHDLLDNFAMARYLLRDGDGLQRCRELCMRCGKDCGWALLSMLVQFADDSGDEQLKRALFSEFLFILDRKRESEEEMTRAWAVTHVLASCLVALLPLIVEALDGEAVPNLEPGDPDKEALRLSILGPSARITQDAASSLAGSVMMLRQGTVADIETVVRVLAEGLDKWRYKARFLGGLAACRTSSARDAIVAYGHRQLRERDDLGSLYYVAESLSCFQHPASRELLQAIGSDQSVGSRTRRVALESLQLLVTYQVVIPPRDEDEIVDGLKILEPNGDRYTDWKVVQDYANYVRGRVAWGEVFGPRVLAALVRALDHDQTYVRRAVAEALGLFDEPAAQSALLSELLEPGLPAEVRGACLASLELQLQRAAESRLRQALRFLILRAARAASDDLTRQGLSSLALKAGPSASEDWLVSPHALEVIPPAAGPFSVSYATIRQDPNPLVMDELETRVTEDVGPEREKKYRIASLSATDRSLRIGLADTTWKIGKSFHLALQRDPTSFLSLGDRWLLPVPLGEDSLPGLAVVHVVVLTSDQKVVAAQRSAETSYAPLHWSSSFEEQVTQDDLASGDEIFHATARRGMREEFGIYVELSSMQVLSVIVELENLNLAVVLLAETRETLDEIRASWSGSPSPQDAWEAVAIEGLEARVQRLRAVGSGSEAPLSPLHPTSRIRCLLLARWLESR